MKSVSMYGAFGKKRSHNTSRAATTASAEPNLTILSFTCTPGQGELIDLQASGFSPNTTVTYTVTTPAGTTTPGSFTSDATGSSPTDLPFFFSIGNAPATITMTDTDANTVSVPVPVLPGCEAAPAPAPAAKPAWWQVYKAFKLWLAQVREMLVVDALER
jgi:hypothetical protein